MTLTQTIEARLATALAAAFPEAQGVDPMLRPSEHADFQANAAMALAKRMGRPPREIAQAIADRLRDDPVIQETSIAGPGFINLRVANGAIDAALTELSRDLAGALGAPARQTVVIDYSAPNVAKEMHVGHLRSSVIGDALARVLEARGHHVVRQNHVGDWGTPFGMLIEHMVDMGEGASASVSDLSAFYQAARAKFDQDAAFAERARKRVVSLQGGDAATLDLWRKLCAISRGYFAQVYERLGLTLTDADIAGESTYNADLPGVVDELTRMGLIVESEGALCVFPAGFTGKEGKPLPLIVRKQDGGYGYATTDLAAIRHRFGRLGADRALYVVGAPQSQHLAMVFATARAAGWLPEGKRAEHVAFGSVLGADKKMFRTRAGESVRLLDLLDEAGNRAAKVVAEKGRDLDEAEQASIARAVGIGAIKYADLSSDRIKDYVFDWDRMLAFEGNTAPYVMYAHARTRSILKKAPADAVRGPFAVAAPAERKLALRLLAFGDVVREVETTLEPHRLSGYLYETANAFSAFFEHCPVLKSEGAERAGRLALTEATADVLRRGLALLGIEAPDRM